MLKVTIKGEVYPLVVERIDLALDRHLEHAGLTSGGLACNLRHLAQDRVADLRCRVLRGVGEEPGPHAAALPVRPPPLIPRPGGVDRVVDETPVQPADFPGPLAALRADAHARVG